MKKYALIIMFSLFGYAFAAPQKQPVIDNDEVVVNAVLPNGTQAEKERLKQLVKKYSTIQYGGNTATSNPSPVKDEDVLKNIKGFNNQTRDEQAKLVKQLQDELKKGK